MKDRVRSVVLRYALYRFLPVRWVARLLTAPVTEEDRAWARQVLREREEEV